MFDNDENREQAGSMPSSQQEGQFPPRQEGAQQPPHIYPPQQTTGQGWQQGNAAFGGQGQPQGGYYAGGYPPYQGHQAQDSQGTPPPPNYGGYQYNPNTGWQPYSNIPQEKYQWDFNAYDQLAPKKKKKRNRGMVVFAMCMICILSVALVTVSGYSIWKGMTGEEAVASAPLPGEADPGEAPAESFVPPEQGDAPQVHLYSRPQEDEVAAADGKLTIPQVAQRVLPSVVGVIRYDNTTFLQAVGVGSGIIMDETGYIVTNAHVVEGGGAFKVETYDGTPYDARLIGYDTQTDLAILKIEAEGLTPARFGDSDDILVGETVVAIGNPGSMTLAGSVTRGIVSAVNRDVNEISGSASSYSMKFIQTDAAINPGNSGGALCNEYGQVIGINSVKVIATGFEGIGFAIPISDAMPVLEDILHNGRVTGRVKLGIMGGEIDEIAARAYNVPMGIVIQSMEETAPIARTAVQLGDIITHIDGERIASFQELKRVLNEHQVGDVITLTMYRQTTTRGVEYEVDVMLVEDQG